MKKAGSSNSKSKTRRTSKNTQDKSNLSFTQSLAVGHTPRVSLDPRDEALFRAFQSNLLSLISHELRTPLTGILNALTLLEENDPGMPSGELIKMAHQNAQRLHQTLVALLDVAALESGTFHARLREVDLIRLAKARMDAHCAFFKDRALNLQEEKASSSQSVSNYSISYTPVLADPQKLARCLDLCLQVLAPRAQQGSSVKLSFSSHVVKFSFELTQGTEKSWESAWSQSLVGFQGGMASPSSAFAGVVQSEQAFLTRAEEGLGSEFLLIHEITRLHHGKFSATQNDRQVTLALELPELTSEEGLRTVLTSRAYQISFGLSSVALVLIVTPEGMTLSDFRDQVKASLLRTTDAVYVLPSRKQIALVLDDYKPENAPLLVNRINHYLHRQLIFGMAHCPADGLDPGALLEIAEKRLAPSHPPAVKD